MRRVLSFIMAFVLLMGVLAVAAFAAPSDETDEVIEETETETEDPAYIPVYVDGEDADPEKLAFAYEDELYVPLETVGEALGSWFYTWNSALQSASLMADDMFLTVNMDDENIEANGKTYKMKNGLQMVDGAAIVQVEQICKAFDVGLDIDEVANIDTSVHPAAEAAAKKKQESSSGGSGSGSSGGGGGSSDGGDSGGSYSDGDLYWLSHIIYAEAGGEGMTGMIAVGNVVLNRVASSSFPNTIKGVIFQKSQFSPSASGSIYKETSQDAINAAKRALAGENVVGNSTFFNRAGMNTWASRNKTLYTTIGNHDFYA